VKASLTTVKIPTALHVAIQKKAQTEGRKIQRIVEDLLRAGLKENNHEQ